ncbi:sensor histidine kinase [Parasphingorhabdus pacifica]
MRTSQDPNTAVWAARLAMILLSRRALIVLLVAAWALEALMLSGSLARAEPLTLVLNALAVVAASWARTRPFLSLFALAGLFPFSALAHGVFGSAPTTIGLATPTETVAVLLVVLHLVRSRPLRLAAPAVGASAAVILLAGFVREQYFNPNGVAFNALLLMLTAGTALYLRHQRSAAINTPLGQLLSSQWPVMAALSTVLFLELINSDFGFSDNLLFLCSAVMSGLAVIAPMRPTETTVLGALTLLLTTMLLQVTGTTGDGFLLSGIPYGAHAASMLLLAFVTRSAAPRQAAYAVSVLLATCLYTTFASSDSLWQPFSQLVQTGLVGGLFSALSVGTGLYFRARDTERARSVRAAVSQAQQEERLALARELHDVVAHHVTGIVVQAQAAQLVAGKNPEAAADALTRISHSGTEALAAMRRLVSSMRDADSTDSSGSMEQASTDLRGDLEALALRTNRLAAENPDAARLELDIELTRDIPQDVARSALRLAQESLTNVEKHALDATLVRITVSTSESYLHVLVSDNGEGKRAQPAGGSGGYGLVGMRERVELVGGRFRVGPSGSGWRVEAWLPLENGDSRPDDARPSPAPAIHQSREVERET